MSVEAPASQPRDWFAVLFGSRVLHADVTYINRFTDKIKGICIDEGVILTEKPFRRTIVEESNVEELLVDIRETLDALGRKHQDDLHMPLMLLIDDQTLYEVYDDYVEPRFNNDAFIYALKAPRIREYMAMDAWDQIRQDIRQQKDIWEEFNPLGPLRVPSRAEERPTNYRDRDDLAYDNRRPSPPVDRYVEAYRNPPPPRPAEMEPVRQQQPRPKAAMTPDVVRSALFSIDENPRLLQGLAEDMDANIDFAGIRELPRPPKDVLNLLELLVIAAEHSPRHPPGDPAKEAGVRLRKRIAETALKSGLMLAVRDDSLGAFEERLKRGDEFTEKEIRERAFGINLLLRAFLLLSKHGLIDDDSLMMWELVEQPVFALPGRFWRTISREQADALCHLAADVTTGDVNVYKDSVRARIEEDRHSPPTDSRRPHPSEDRRPDARRGARRDDPGAPGPSSSAYKYDPYNMDDDESDTTEVYPPDAKDEGRGGSSSRGSTPNEMDLIDEEEERGRGGGGRRRRASSRERRAREEWEEDQRRQREEEEEAARLAEEAREAEAAREYERRRHNLALQQLERKKWEESNEQCIAWRDDDAGPADSYRTLATRPVYADLYMPKMPYMRRALVSGAYADNEHYLDVQYRLMREDMVAPLRDGIYSQKIITEPGQLITSSNELKIYPTIQLGALQVRSIDGAPMRVVNIPQHMLLQIREERQLKFGQCVVASSDKFTQEFHVGWICDRFQEPGLPWQGRLAISFFDECFPVNAAAKPIDKTATYALAESPAYLEAYTHVLRVLKKMRKNVVFPLERYLVHMKKNTRLPQYMRSKEKDEDREEDKERVVMYEKKKKEEENKQREKERKKEKRLSRSRSREGNDDDDAVTTEEHVTTEEGASEENLADDGFNTDEEDSFLTGGRHSHPNPKDLETISIEGRVYRVDQLAEEYKTDVLDETQRKAMCYALTSELAIIQGPPGTGKTHIGVEIVMTILENRTKWRMTEPILIVTFSNQALDHFLDKIRVQIEARGLGSEGTPAVVRLGSRSEHDAIKLNCLLSTVMKDYEEDLAGEAFGEKVKARKNKQASLERLVRAVKTVQISRKSIMEYNALRQLMDPTHDQQLRQAAYGLRDSNGNPLNMDEVLVSWLLNKSYEKKRDLPPGSDDDSEDEETMWGGGVAMHAQRKPASKKAKNGGRETKKEKNERKRAERRGHKWKEGEDSSDTEDEDESPPELMPADANDEEGEDDTTTAELLDLLKKLNDCALKEQSTLASEEKWRRLAEKYEMDEDWEAEREYAQRNNGRTLVNDVEIFSRTVKQGIVKGRGPGGKERQQVNVDPAIVRDIAEHKQYILVKDPLSAEEVAQVRDVRTLPKEQRWRLLVRWQLNLANACRNSLDIYSAAYAKACTRAEALADVSRAAVLRKALVVGATTTGSAKRRALVSRIAPKVLVVEEAAEVLEAHLLASIVPSVQHAIFIGDHQQLRPSTAVHHLAKLANMEVSLFERLVKNGYPFHTLGKQHRMLEPLTKHVVRPFFYKMLEDAPSIFKYPSVAGMATNLFFWAHNVPEDTVNDSMSKKNVAEAQMCVNLANYILMQGQYRADQITIIGMYGAQVLEIKRRVQDTRGALNDVAVETVDSFQGKENRVMILSLVRSCSGGVGFLAIANRITVALTRAQHGMYVCGNFADIAEYSDMWHNIVGSLNGANLIDYVLPVVCQRHGQPTAIRCNRDFERSTPLGGCTKPCGYKMPCEHLCKNVCHPPYQHERPCADGPNLECKETCVKRCQKCGARCTKKCQEPCGTCHAIVTLELGCGHNVRCECGARNLARCKEPCAELLDCGHTCQNKCSVDCLTEEQCEQGVNFEHPRCRHKLVLPCNQVRPYEFGFSTVTPACYEKCPERLVCGHKCPLNCGEPCPSSCDTIVYFEGACGHKLQKKCSEEARHIKCTALVDSDMPHCSHRIKMECYQSRNQNECRSACKKPTSCGHECSLSCGECYKRASAHECSAPCMRDLPCGHPCQGRCGRPCVCLSSCRVRCSHLRCGSMAKDKLCYGRTCSQPCVQCVEPCDNHCEHRGCTKMCFEVCDTKECSEPCRKVLRCGHGCLGLCGEPCPSLCGTCKTAAYKTLIEQFPADAAGEKELPRLIQMPDCAHIFPYKYMDKHVAEQLAAGAIVLRCPRCSGLIEDCKRYLKHTKRLWKEADTRKWEKRMAEEEMSKAELLQRYGKMRNEMQTSQDAVASYAKYVAQNCGNAREVFALDTFRALEAMFIELRAVFGLVDSRAEYYYWQAVQSCHKSICGLVVCYLEKWDLFKVDMVFDAQVNLKSVMEEAFDRRRSRLFPMRDQFRAMTQVVRDSLSFRRVGQLVPAFRAAMLRSTLYYHMEYLHATLRGKRSDQNGEMLDLSVAQTVAYKRVIKMILKDSPAEQPHKKLEDLMAKIHEDVYGKLLRTEFVPFHVALPEF